MLPAAGEVQSFNGLVEPTKRSCRSNTTFTIIHNYRLDNKQKNVNVYSVTFNLDIDQD